MSGIVIVYFLITLSGGGTLATFSSNSVYSSSLFTYQNSSTTVSPLSTTIPLITSTRRNIHQHHHHQHHKHRSRTPLSPFTSRGLAIINRCTLNIQNKARRKLQKWSDEYLIRPLTLQQFKPDVLNLPHKIGGLFSRTGVWSEMVNDNTVPNKNESWLESYRIRGTRNVDSRYALMEFYSIAIGLISIRGLETKDFLCMNTRGELYPAPINNYTVECIFTEEALDNYYNIYTSCAHGYPDKEWHIAFKHSGVPKKGRHVSKIDAGAQFIVKELNKDFWVPPQVLEEPPKRLSGFDDDGFNWLVPKWPVVLSKPPKLEQPELMDIENTDNIHLNNHYDKYLRPASNGYYYSSSKDVQESKTVNLNNNNNVISSSNDANTVINNNNERRKKIRLELSDFIERKKRRMHREERRRKHRRKALKQLKEYSQVNVARYNHSKSLTNRLKNLPTN